MHVPAVRNEVDRHDGTKSGPARRGQTARSLHTALAVELPTAAGDFRIHNTRRLHHQCHGLPNNALLRYHDAILFPCYRAIEFESGREDGMNCACTVRGQLCSAERLHNDKKQDRATQPGANEVLFWTGNRSFSPTAIDSNRSEWFFSTLTERKVQTAKSNLFSENSPATPHRLDENISTLCDTRSTSSRHIGFPTSMNQIHQLKCFQYRLPQFHHDCRHFLPLPPEFLFSAKVNQSFSM